ncbi:assimilatory sulfite reductase (NADPH) flavoprotein subunit [Motilimonas sp. 1_MG-2023]|uniref:assimilatory sulfite reductase (NADPH) flavoprotein subunit n=1 Tax=Motilimonas sp. 1_MG-2023 TaxID=3062672 RepID=UPI0026E340FD|nr:assimilatory sulfite reductase (NADPH) flavoprotein subunit [Motilimonas sp. 1_MG-2023]MDO6524490.1 assimilatory sulfite reductase (NADPH) flavoprotein subunit [Motilimonas sp. 1_MG-2023]
MLLKELSSLTSPLSDLQLNQLQQAIAELNPNQLAWVSGYLSGISQGGAVVATGAVSAAAVSAAPAGQLTVLFGSQTGNSKGVAEELAAAAKAQGLPVQVKSMANYKAKDLKTETHLIIVVSTNGEGEAPDDAIELHELLGSKKAPKLPELNYAVLALGDSSYEFFCQTGKDFDERLAATGAQSFLERLDCDVDYEAPAKEWGDKALKLVSETLVTSAQTAPAAQVFSAPAPLTASQYDKKNPYTATLATNQKITGRNSQKDVRHFEISLEDSGIQYRAGDALGVWFENDSELVDQVVKQVGLSGDEQVEVDGEKVSLRQALISHYELTQSYPGFVEKYAEISGSKKLAKIAADKAQAREYANSHQILDILAVKKNASLTAEQLIAMLRRITPRLYSIASSQAEVDEEVHLTVGMVEFENEQGEPRSGGATGFLKRLEEGGEVKVFVEHNDNFRLPANPETPVIMVGPGTGVAPFRAFMQERDAQSAGGKNWMFFGDQTFTEDFLYQVEWRGYLDSGLLTKMDVAFSRDQEEKVYVQHRLLENAAQVYQWLEDGAHFYICGDANRMAKDVNDALVKIVQEQGKKSFEEAEEYVSELRRAKRYQRDVY